MKNKKHVLEVGLVKFAFTSAAQAAKAYELLSGAVEVDNLIYLDNGDLWREVEKPYGLNLKAERFKFATPEQVKQEQSSREAFRTPE